MFGYFKASEDGILRHHYHQRFFFFLIYSIRFVLTRLQMEVALSILFDLYLAGIRAKIAAFQITLAISMRVLERGLLTLDHLYYHFFIPSARFNETKKNCKQFIITSVRYQK